MRFPFYSSLVCLLLCFLVLMTASAEKLQRLPRQGGVYVIAHRGAHEGIPENTLAAYAKAIALGADFVEVDLRATKDGHIISMHNAEVDAYTKDAKGPVEQFTLAELKAMDIGSRIGPEWKNERIPTLEEILDLCRGKIGLYIDLKNAPVEQIVRELRARGMEKDAVWYAGSKPLRDLAKLCPECSPMPEGGSEKGLERVLKLHHPPVVAGSFSELTENYVIRCHDVGAIVFVDDDGPESWAKMLQWKVDGIQTDHLSVLIEQLKNKGK